MSTLLPETDPEFFIELWKDPRKVQPLNPKLLRRQGGDFLNDPAHNNNLDDVDLDVDHGAPISNRQ